MKSSGSAPGFAREKSAPSHLIGKQSKAMDPSRGPAPNKGQTATSKGGRGKGSGKD